MPRTVVLGRKPAKRYASHKRWCLCIPNPYQIFACQNSVERPTNTLSKANSQPGITHERTRRAEKLFRLHLQADDDFFYVGSAYPSKMWCRRTVAYNQEDCAALLSPDLFRQFLLPVHLEQCRAAEVNFIHLHSSCLYPVDILLENRCYDVLEINIDHPGGASPSLPELLPALKKIQTARMPLLLWGELTPGEWRRLRTELSPIGLSLQPIVRRAADLLALLEALR